MSVFQRLKANIQHALNDAPREAAKIIELQAHENFRNQSDETGKRWAPRKKPVRKYAYRGKRKIKLSENRAILVGVGSGQLRNSIQISKVDRKRVVFTMFEYGLYHNEGKSPQPKREFLAVRGKTRKKIRDAYIRKINKAIQKSKTR